MSDIVIVKPENCVGCNACVRACPVPEANISKQVAEGKFITSVNSEKCVGCGACVSACSHGARDYVDDTEACMSLLGSEKLILLVTPAIKSVLPNKWKDVLDWFRKKGCLIYDVSFGADICTWAHIRAIESNQIGNVVSQQCPAVVKYIEAYQPKLLQNISPIHSPTLCLATYIRKYLRRTNPIAVLSPCIAARMENEETGLVEYNMTIKKLMEYFDKNDIRIPTSDPNVYEYQFDEQQGQLGSVFTRPGGMRDALHANLPDLSIANTEGVSVYQQLDMYAMMSDNKRPQVFDVFSCQNGCNMGPGTGSRQNVFDVSNIMKNVEKNARERRKGSGLFNRGGDDKLFKAFDEELQLADFIRSYRPGRPTMTPSDEQLQPIYESMGKLTDEERHYDCRACGNNTCREMAISIFRGLNTPNNCIVHAKSVLLASHSTLTNKHEKLAAITEECLGLSDKLMTDIEQIGNNMTSIGESTTKTHERANVVNDLLKNIVTFCNGNPTMDEASVKQLTAILETTIKAFGAVDDNVNVTNESSSAIKKSIDQITEVIGKLNAVLMESESQDLQ